MDHLQILHNEAAKVVLAARPLLSGLGITKIVEWAAKRLPAVKVSAHKRIDQTINALMRRHFYRCLPSSFISVYKQ